MSALEPGLYRASVRGVADVTVMVIDAPDRINGYAYTLTPHDADHYGVHLNEVTDARPLIVLDLDDPDAQQAIWQLRAIRGGMSTERVMGAIADQIEAQTKPARIEEPGPGEHVTACHIFKPDPETFLHLRLPPPKPNEEPYEWASLATGHVYKWTSLIDPTLVRDGLS